MKNYNVIKNPGPAEAQTVLGLSYYHGWGVPQNEEEGLRWLRKAVAQGCEEAITLLAELEPDWAELAYLAYQDAKQGDIEAQLLLADCYFFGIGVPQDESEAFKWFLLAALQGDVMGLCNVAACYGNGCGVKQDYEIAITLYRQLIEEEELPAAQSNLGLCYFAGQGVEQNFSEAARWFTLAAEQGHPNAEFFLGECYLFGLGVPQDAEIAVELYYLAAMQGHSEAQFRFAECLFNGWGIPQDKEEGAMWFHLVAERDDEEAMRITGVMKGGDCNTDKLSLSTGQGWNRLTCVESSPGSSGRSLLRFQGA